MRIKKTNTNFRYSLILLRQLVVTDFKLRYQGSFLGYLWTLLKPLFLFIILYTVFVNFLKIGSDIPNFPIYLLLGIIMFNFFSEMTSLSLNSIVSRGDLISKIRIPRWIVVFSASITALINLAINLVVVVVFMIINNADLLMSSLLFPFVLLQFYILSLGISLMLATAYVKYRDIGHIWDVALQGLFYLTPVLYPVSIISNDLYQKLLLLNPLAQIIQDARYTLITHETDTISNVFGNSFARLITISICLVVLYLGLLYFRKNAKNFAEDI